MAYMSCGLDSWLIKMTWILCKDCSRGLHNIIPKTNPVSILDMALLSMIFTVAHMKTGARGGVWPTEAETPAAPCWGRTGQTGEATGSSGEPWYPYTWRFMGLSIVPVTGLIELSPFTSRVVDPDTSSY